MTSDAGLIEVPPDLDQHVAARRPQPLTHRMSDHELLRPGPLGLLAARLGRSSVTYQPAQQPLVVATEKALDLPDEPEALLRDLSDNGSWLTLLHIERDPPYRSLVDTELDAVAARCGRPRHWARRRSGFVFASSPRSVTPAHFDIEQSLILQLRGTRTLVLGRFADPATRAREVDRYWSGSFGRIEDLPEPIGELPLAPGLGAYLPPYQPHWIHNDDGPSESLTLTFFTRDNLTESMVQSCNTKLRRLHLRPSDYGQSRGRDATKAALMQGYTRARSIVESLRAGGPSPTPRG